MRKKQKSALHVLKTCSVGKKRSQKEKISKKMEGTKVIFRRGKKVGERGCISSERHRPGATRILRSKKKEGKKKGRRLPWEEEQKVREEKNTLPNW